MKNAILLAASMIMATPAMAERNAIVSVDAVRAFIIGVDMDSILTIDGKQRAWTFVFFSEDTNNKPVYTQALMEFDCKLERSQTLDIKLFGEGGVKIGNLDPTPWTYPAPNTAEFRTMDYVYGKPVPAANVTTDTLPSMFA